MAGELNRATSEVRLFTGAGVAFAAVGVAGSVSPSIDGFLSACTGWALGVGGGVTVAWMAGRWAWQSWLLHWECTRPIRPGEITWLAPAPKVVERDA